MNALQMKEGYNAAVVMYNAALKCLAADIKLIAEKMKMEVGYNPVEHIKYRIKDFDSLVNKIIDHNLPLDWNMATKSIFDIGGIRVVCNTLDDVNLMVNTIQEIQGVKVLKIKDYITYPKKSGYRSIHIIIEYKELFLEIQVRTMAQDNWAAIEHKFKYKFQGTLPETTKKELVSMSDLAYEMDVQFSAINPYK